MSRLQRLVEAEFGGIVWRGLPLTQQLALLQRGKPAAKRFSTPARADQRLRELGLVDAEGLSPTGRVVLEHGQRSLRRAR